VRYVARSAPLTISAALAYRREEYLVETVEESARTYGSGTSRRIGGPAITAEESADTSDEDTQAVDLLGWQASLGFGLWQPLGMGVAWLTLNNAWQTSQWDDAGGDLAMPAGEVEHSYPFVELGGSYQIWTFGLRLADLDAGPGALLWAGVGGSQVDGSYSRPPEVQARPGVHY
jgi:hypothetical protein